MAVVGASSSLPPMPVKVASPSRRRPLRHGDGNWSSCPVTDIGHVLVDHSRALPIPKNIHQQRKGRGGLPPARIVKVVARIVRAPVRQHSLEAALGNMWLRHILRHVGQAEPAQRVLTDWCPHYSG